MPPLEYALYWHRHLITGFVMLYFLPSISAAGLLIEELGSPAVLAYTLLLSLLFVLIVVRVFQTGRQVIKEDSKPPDKKADG